MRLRTIAFAVTGCVTLAFAGCSNDAETSSGRATAVVGVPDGAAYVDQHSLKFSPKNLTVSASEPVYFKNSESTVHSVTINGKNESGTMERDKVFTWNPPTAGEYKVSCDFHPQMKATIKVE